MTSTATLTTRTMSDSLSSTDKIDAEEYLLRLSKNCEELALSLSNNLTVSLSSVVVGANDGNNVDSDRRKKTQLKTKNDITAVNFNKDNVYYPIPTPDSVKFMSDPDNLSISEDDLGCNAGSQAVLNVSSASVLVSERCD